MLCLAGSSVILMNVERMLLPDRFNNLIRRQFHRSADDVLSIDIGGRIRKCHKNFQLFLITSLPVDRKCKDFCNFAISFYYQSTFCYISL